MLVGAGFGIAAALLMAGAPRLERALGPLLVVAQALPVFAIAPLLVVWLGFGLSSKLAMAALIIFFPVSTSLLRGPAPHRRKPDRPRPPQPREPARHAPADPRPAALPALGAGLRVAAAGAPIGAIVGEWVGSSSGLGLLMLHANARMQTDMVFAGLAVLVAFSLALWAVVGALTRRLVFWAPDTLSPRLTNPDRPETDPCAKFFSPLPSLRDWSLARVGRADDKLTLAARLVRQPRPCGHRDRQAGRLFHDGEGLDVTFIEPADPPMPPRLVAAGQGDIALTYQPTFYLDVADGLPSSGRRVDRDPAEHRWCAGDGPIKTLADLKGKTVGYSVAGYEKALLGTMLASAGLTLDDVKLVNVNFALVQPLLGGQVDAVIGAYRNFELTEMQPRRPSRPRLLSGRTRLPALRRLIYVTTPEKAKRPPAPLPRRRGTGELFILNHPEEAWDSFIKAYPKLDDELNRQAWTETIPRLSPDPPRSIRCATPLSRIHEGERPDRPRRADRALHRTLANARLARALTRRRRRRLRQRRRPAATR